VATTFDFLRTGSTLRAISCEWMIAAILAS
jgi:hypothetical protein